MTIEQLQQLAFDFGFGARAHYTSHTQLIRDIQLRRGGDPCFLTDRRYVCIKKCEFSTECRKLKAHWMR
jgi:hypothetical protein